MSSSLCTIKGIVSNVSIFVEIEGNENQGTTRFELVIYFYDHPPTYKLVALFQLDERNRRADCQTCHSNEQQEPECEPYKE
jgi:hypothetical protein